MKFIQNEVFSDCNNCSLGGGAIGVYGNPINHRIEFDNCLFERNGVESNGNDVYLSGTLDVSEVALTVKNSIFRSNFINSSGSNGNADGVVFKLHLGPQNSWSSIPNSVIERSLFEDNSVSVSNNNSTLLLSTATKTLLQNNLIVNNNSSEPYRFFRSDPSYDSNGNGPEILFQNNTIYNNKAESFMEAVGFGAKVEFINNIIWENNFPNGNEFNYAENDGVTISLLNNILKKEFIKEGRNGFNHFGNIHLDPNFRSPGAGDFRLRGNSPGIDAGDNVNYPIYDFRGYYRTGEVDIGAFESGASKYILAIEMDLIIIQSLLLKIKGKP